MIDFEMRTKTLLNSQDFLLSSKAAPKEQKQRKREIKMTEKLAEFKAKEATMGVKDFLLQRELKLVNRSSQMQSQNINYLKVALLGYERMQTPETQHRIDQM